MPYTATIARPRHFPRLARTVLAALTAVAAVLAYGAPARAAEIVHGRDGSLHIVTVSGEIIRGDADRFLRAVAAIPRTTVAAPLVVLESPGGLVVEGLLIGETIRVKGFATSVPAKKLCASTCGLIWLAGSQRFASSSARIGFHAAFVENAGGVRETGLGNALIGAYLSRLGLSYRAIAFATSAAPREMAWLHAGEAKRAGIDVVVIRANAGPADVPAGRPAPAPSAARMASMDTPSYTEGRRARLDYEAWFAGLPEGSYREGVAFWAANRSARQPDFCVRADADRAWQGGCAEGRARLTPIDAKRRTDKEFWGGWNSLQ